MQYCTKSRSGGCYAVPEGVICHSGRCYAVPEGVMLFRRVLCHSGRCYAVLDVLDEGTEKV